MGGVDRRRGRPGSVAPSTRGASVGERLVLDIWISGVPTVPGRGRALTLLLLGAFDPAVR